MSKITMEISHPMILQLMRRGIHAMMLLVSLMLKPENRHEADRLEISDLFFGAVYEPRFDSYYKHQRIVRVAPGLSSREQPPTIKLESIKGATRIVMCEIISSERI